MIFSGVSAATVLAAPVGSFLGDIIGWRSVFVIVAVLGAVTLIVQFVSLPRMAPTGLTHLRTLIDVVARPGVAVGMIAAMLIFSGHFAFFTYIRPFLETVTGVGINTVSAILLGFGTANFVGTLLAGVLLERSLRLTLTLMPLLMGILGLGLVTLGSQTIPVSVMVGLWGLPSVPCRWPGRLG
jgi:predicted MFS family arabinose efflux permease